MAESGAKLWIVSAAVVCLLNWWPQEAAGEPKTDGVTLSFVRVEETRRTEFVSKKAKPYGFKKPGLELTYELTLPDGMQILDIDQPEEITASDSRRRDLTDIEKSFTGERKYVDLRPMPKGNKPEVTLQLALPKRQAKHFSVSTTFDVWGYREMTESVVRVGTKPVTLDATLFGGTTVTAVLEDRGNHAELKLTPGTIKRFVEGVTLSDGSDDYRSNLSAQNDDKLIYFFSNTKVADTMTAKFTIRSGLSRMPCTVALENQPLP